MHLYYMLNKYLLDEYFSVSKPAENQEITAQSTPNIKKKQELKLPQPKATSLTPKVTSVSK